MGQDIRKMMRDHSPEKVSLPDGHEDRFEARLALLENEKRKGLPLWLKIAAIVIAICAVGSFAYYTIGEPNGEDRMATETQEESVESPETVITLGDISPDLKKVEEYYTAGINVQLASLQVTDENKELVDRYLQRLRELDTEYKKLNQELNEVGPTEATITALIDNLQLRLELLFKLKNKLKELKNQNNEDVNLI